MAKCISWLRAGGSVADSLNGPWSAASTSLPPDFAQIPDTDPAAFVKASVPGTREAQDAVLLASIPSTTTVQVAPSQRPWFTPVRRNSSPSRAPPSNTP
jgi:hypothetical protein